MFYTYRTIKSSPIKPQEWRYNSGVRPAVRTDAARWQWSVDVALYHPLRPQRLWLTFIALFTIRFCHLYWRFYNWNCSTLTRCVCFDFLQFLKYSFRRIAFAGQPWYCFASLLRNFIDSRNDLHKYPFKTGSSCTEITSVHGLSVHMPRDILLNGAEFIIRHFFLAVSIKLEPSKSRVSAYFNTHTSLVKLICWDIYERLSLLLGLFIKLLCSINMRFNYM